MKTKSLLAFAIITLSASHHAIAENFPELVVPLGLGVSTHFHSLPKSIDELDQLSEAGIHFGRTSLEWQTVEKVKGKYDFSAYIDLADGLRGHGIRPLFILAYGNPIYHSTSGSAHNGPSTPELRAAFARYSEAAARTFKGKGVVWEVWNEPNIRPFWKPEPNAKDYFDLLQTTSLAIRAADPDALIIAPALASNNRRARKFLTDLLSLGVLKFIDGISVHPYRKENPESVINYYRELRELIQSHSPDAINVPIISSEWGYSASDFSSEQQANFSVRAYLVNLSAGVPISIWYDWRNAGQDPSRALHNFGLLKQDYSKKPAYLSLQKMTNELGGFKFARRISLNNNKDWILEFTKGDVKKLAFWTEKTSHLITLGNLSEPKKVLTLTPSPQYTELLEPQPN